MEILVEAKLVWARSGKKVKRKIRCTTGRRKGRVVSSAGSCTKKIDIKKRFLLKRTKARMKSRMKIKAMRTKKYNPVSKRVRRMNAMRKGRR
jgi:hypothetical protein